MKNLKIFFFFTVQKPNAGNEMTYENKQKYPKKMILYHILPTLLDNSHSL